MKFENKDLLEDKMLELNGIELIELKILSFISKTIFYLVGADVGDMTSKDGLPARHDRLVVHVLCELWNCRLCWQT